MQSPESVTFADRLLTGDTEILVWLSSRCERVASPQFSFWAWDWIREDFISDVVAQLTATFGRGSFQLQGDAGAYVDTTIRNLCRSYFRELARSRLQSPLEAVPESSLSVKGDTVAAILAVVDLKRTLARLSPSCRNLIVSKYVHGNSLSEIGDDLGIEAKTARSRLHTCRERLRELWRKLST